MNNLNKKLSVSIGIIAYNEEGTIESLVRSLLTQVEDSFKIERIFVLSDGSTDKTVARLLGLSNKRVKVLVRTRRKGKSQRLNELFACATSDIVINMDADISLANPRTITQLVTPFINDSQVMLVSGKIVPFDPQSFSERVVSAGVVLMNEAKQLVKENDLYNCTGAIRAFRKKLYKEIHFPKLTAEDIYPYLYCLTRKYSFKVAPEAVVRYQLPHTYREYVRQMTRYLSSPKEHIRYFPSKLVKEKFSITTRVKLYACFKGLLNDPVWTCLYLVYLALPKLNTLLTPFRDKQRGVWEVSRT